jgi:ABC-2 type transport system ATP-binding protein
MSTDILAIAATGVSKAYDECIAIRDVSLQVPCGSIFGFVGPNGAGKTTTIRCLTGTTIPTAGEILLLGRRLDREPVQSKQIIGVMPEGLALFDQLRCSEFLLLSGRIFGLDKEVTSDRVRELLDVFGLAEADNIRLADLSHGMRKKIAFAAAVIHSPKILFLDEPFESIDPATVAMLKDWLRRYASHGGTVFITSHILATVEELCNDIAIIDKGELRWRGRMCKDIGFVHGGLQFGSLEELFLALTGRIDKRLSWL